MTGRTTHEGPAQDHGAQWLRRDPELVEQERLLWQMTADERVAAMRAGRLTTHQCSRWAARRSDEVPLLNGEFEFIAIRTPEVAES